MPDQRLPDDLRVVNCAGCRALLSAEPERLCGLPGVGGRIKGPADVPRGPAPRAGGAPAGRCQPRGPSSCARAAVAAARLAYPGWVAYQDTCTIAFRVRPGESRERASERAFAERVAPPREVIDLAAAWLADPTLERARALEPYCQENELGEPFGLGTAMPMWARSLAAGVLRVSGVDPLTMASHPSYGVLEAAKEHGEEQVLTAVRDALAVWALGEGARG